MRASFLFALALVSLVACSGVGDALVDAGHMLSPDASAQDGGGSPARARVVESPCNGQGIFGVNAADGSTERFVTYYAAINDAAIASSAPNVEAWVCGRTVLGSDPDAHACPAGAHCTDDRPTHLDCLSVPVELRDGIARVSCGTSIVTDVDGPSGPTPSIENGARYDVARFVVR